MIAIIAFLMMAVGVEAAFRANHVAINRWYQGHYREVAYGFGLFGGLVLMFLFAYNRPGMLLVVAVIFTAIAATVIHWHHVGLFLRRHWFQIVGALTLVGAVVWLMRFLGAMPSGQMLFWTIVVAIVAALIVWWSAFWTFVGAHWRLFLGVTVAIILIAAFARATPTIANSVSGFWSGITSGVSAVIPAPSSSAVTNQSTLVSSSSSLPRTAEEIADCRRRIANTPPYIDPDSLRGRRLCGN